MIWFVQMILFIIANPSAPGRNMLEQREQNHGRKRKKGVNDREFSIFSPKQRTTVESRHVGNTDLLWVVNRQGFRVGVQRVLGGFELMSKRPDKDNISVKNK